MKLIATAIIILAVALLATTGVVADTMVWSTNLQASTIDLYPQFTPHNANQVIDMDDTNIFTADSNGTVYSIEKATGTIVWTVQPTTNMFETVYLFLVSPSCLVYYNGNGLWGLHKGNGTTMWQQYVNLTKSTVVVGFHVRVLDEGRFMAVGNTQVNVMDAATGSFVWGLSNANVNVNQIVVGDGHVVSVNQQYTSTSSTNEAVVYDSLSGELLMTIPGATQCSNLQSGSGFIACIVLSGDKKQLEVVNLKTQQVAWKSTVLQLATQPTLRVQGDVLMMFESPNQFAGTKGYAAGFSLAKGGAALWNTTLGATANSVLPYAMYGHNGLLIVGVTTTPTPTATQHPTGFIALDKASGRVAWTLDVPTNVEAEVTFIGDNMLFPNVVGWHRLALSSPTATQPPVSKFSTLTAFTGVTSILAVGHESEYIVLAGSRIERHKME